MTEFNYNDIIEYIDGTRDLHLEEAIKWAKENMAHIEEIGLKDGKIRQFKIIEMSYEEKITSQIAELQAELAKSDYIDNKFIEAIVKNDMILLDTLKVKYKDKLEERQAIRNRIDELEEILNGGI